MSLIALLWLASSVNAEPPLVIRNAAVETMAAAGRMDQATVLVRNGKIEAVGKDVAIPDDARVIDAAGGTLMPGLIDPYFEVAVAAASVDAGPRTVVVGGRSITLPGGLPARGGSFTRVADNYYPYDAGYKPLPRAGLCRLNLVTGGTGQAAVVRVTPTEPGRMLDRADGVAFASLTNQSDSLDTVRSRLESAARAKSGGPTGMARMLGLGNTAGTQLWADVHDGKAPLIVSVANSAAVVHALKLVEPYKNVKLTLVGSGVALTEAADALKGRGVRVVIRPGLELYPNSRDRFAPARLLHERGVDVAFTLSGRPSPAPTGLPDFLGAAPPSIDDGVAAQDFPLFPVALLVKCGLPRPVALEALTKRPAAILGLDNLGTIEPGKAADLVLFTGDPLDPAGRLRMTIIDGRTAYESN
jgi:hypothetical protein